MLGLAEKTSRKDWEALVTLHPKQSFTEHRRHNGWRSPAMGSARLVFKQQDGRPEVRAGRVLNISPGGVQIWQAEDINWGTEVVVQVRVAERDMLLFGRVAHCTEAVGGFKVGVELQFS